MSTNVTFQSVNEEGWRRGFKNILSHENSNWWRTRRWWINILIWLVLANGAVYSALNANGDNAVLPPSMMIGQAVMVFVVMTGMFGSVAAIVAMQGSVIDEKKSGTAAWIMSKPSSRSAFILSKLIANVVAMTVIIYVVQGTLTYIQLATYPESEIALGAFVAGAAVLALHQVFYLSLTLMLGTIFSERGAVIAIPLGVLFSASLIARFMGSLVNFLPWGILPGGDTQGLAMEAILGQALSNITPIIATCVWIVIFVAIALWRFQREEF